MSKLKIMLNELNTFLNNSEEDEKVVLILCSTKETDLLERANVLNKEITGTEALTSNINTEVYLLRTGEVNKLKNAVRKNNGATFFIYNHKHIISRTELEIILEETNQQFDFIFYEDMED